MTSIERQGGPRRPARRAWPVLAAFLVPLALGLAGCSDTPENCLVEDEGFLSFEILPEGNDTFTARFVSVQDLLTNPPTVRYRFARDGGGEVLLDTPDVAGYRFGFVPGRSYTVTGEFVKVSILEGYSLAISDSLGVFALMESDLEARNNDPNQPFDFVFRDGYPLDGLTVSFEDGGCESRVALTPEYQSITNWTLTFALGDQVVGASHGRTFVLGEYEAHVFRAERRVVKTGPWADSATQPQLSWAMQRIDP